ncbi:alpha/beta hydrolase [Halomicroarcula sp. F27]|uniref:Alpha/beta hydrolase n=1 Tax=Haloarcula nitratireducens TaxID=2487749 RepID=A0AAW4PJV4_9EURY|nr:alpha/beta hydrolase [Halomicroarcula nitratireducens]MBX0297843.1 alpha/beta hydrolase [Halomicroarcula nitratireducens]
MASEFLDEITMPTLFIVGGDNTQVELNREAYDQLPSEKELHVVEGAGHLFEDEGELEEVADVAADWLSGRYGERTCMISVTRTDSESSANSKWLGNSLMALSLRNNM